MLNILNKTSHEHALGRTQAALTRLYFAAIDAATRAQQGAAALEAATRAEAAEQNEEQIEEANKSPGSVLASSENEENTSYGNPSPTV